MSAPTPDLAEVAAHFALPGSFEDAALHGSGHIHETFVARHRDGARLHRTILQRLNTRIFSDPVAVMENVARVCAHLQHKLREAGERDVERRSLRLIPSRTGRSYHVDASGGWWRAFAFVEASHSVDAVTSPAQAFEAGRAFGSFATQLADLPGPPLVETLPRFHDLAGRFDALDAALRNDPHRRASALARDVERAHRLRDRVEAALVEHAAGPLPVRVVHNDCKINNLLFDDASGEALCVIDLDTVMPGTLLADFGELVRTGTCRSPEDEPEPARMRLESDLFEALARGYLNGAGALIEPEERAALPLAGPLMALENAVRFLADHVAGDVYFRIHRQGHNRDRGRAQLRLAELQLAERDAWTRRVEQAARELGIAR